ncbi:phosphopantetheine-binding protein [Micromonospora sp. WMMD1082]|uniref:phosphopantetheine-binding protein n=1 Tax=Micromonospora sp. WMMD1082 TaxID=3016104 RepID=UPI0024178567|nr:phosphopantetheine-binding protein [Micromonospora sp. WMMD1082]MDG4792801.1 phosphopantetheine-binding protein [Micromonospora sp. WMMD1082]
MISPPTAATVGATIIRLLTEMTGIDPASLTDDTRIFMELGLTSARILELLMRLEEELGQPMVDRVDWLRMETIADLAGFVAGRQGGAASRS